jgi:hypothetical protein
MGKPMADDEKELKDQRVVTMMSPSELEAIDNWMFANRIRSRGEAIRRLCQMGMYLDEKLPTVVDTPKEIVANIQRRREEVNTVAELGNSDTSAFERLLVATRYLEIAITDLQIDRAGKGLRLMVTLNTLKGTGDLSRAMIAAKELQKIFDRHDSGELPTFDALNDELEAKFGRRLLSRERSAEIGRQYGVSDRKPDE